jgi:hypothetical protein
MTYLLFLLAGYGICTKDTGVVSCRLLSLRLLICGFTIRTGKKTAASLSATMETPARLEDTFAYPNLIRALDIEVELRSFTMYTASIAGSMCACIVANGNGNPL